MVIFFTLETYLAGGFVFMPVFMVSCLYCMSRFHGNLLVYMLLIEGLNMGVASLMVCYPQFVGGYGLFVFLAMVACETSLGLALLVSLLRRSGNGLVATKSVSKAKK